VARWPSVEAAIEAGKTSTLSRVKAGIPLMQRYQDILQEYREDFPFGLLVVKGAFESKGNATVKSAVDSRGRQAVGLFQLFTGVQGLSASELQNPTLNTQAFIRLVQERASDLEKTHAPYFARGRDYQFWCTVLWTTMIGPGAVRAILDRTRPTSAPFDNAIAWIKANPREMEKDALESRFGVQGGRLTAFRSVVTQRMCYMATAIVPTSMGIESTSWVPLALAALAGAVLLWR